MYSPSRFRSEGGGPDLVFGNAFWRKIHKRVIFFASNAIRAIQVSMGFLSCSDRQFSYNTKKILKYNTLKIRIEDTA